MGKRPRIALRHQGAKVTPFERGAMVNTAHVRLDLRQLSSVRGRLRDVEFDVRAPTDYELWSRLLSQTLIRMGYAPLDMMLGFLADLINSMGEERRKTMTAFIVQGLGLQIIEQAGWVCRGCGMAVKETVWHPQRDGAGPFPHRMVAEDRDGNLLMIQGEAGEIAQDVLDERGLTIVPCMGLPERQPVFERFMDPTYLPLTIEEAQPTAPKLGIWLPGSDPPRGRGA